MHWTSDLMLHIGSTTAGHQGTWACSRMATAWKSREPLNERFVPYKKQRHSSTLMAGSVQFVSELAVGEWESIKTRSFEMGLHTWWVGGTFIQIRLNLVIAFSAEKAVLRFQNPSGYPPQTYPHVDQKCNKKKSFFMCIYVHHNCDDVGARKMSQWNHQDGQRFQGGSTCALPTLHT